MSYDYRETEDEIILEKGIIDREMWKDYPHGKEWVSYDALQEACEYQDVFPVVLDSTHDHTRPLTDPTRAIGRIAVAPCPEKRALRIREMRLKKRKLPEWLLEKIRRHEPLPISPFKFITTEDDQQAHILFDHVAILEESTPRCDVPRCGVGVYDANMTEQESKPAEKPLSSPLSSEKEGKPKPAASQEPVAAEAAAEPPKDAVSMEDKEDIEAIKTQLKDAQKAVIELEDRKHRIRTQLVEHGLNEVELRGLSLDSLEKVLSAMRKGTTQALPGAVPTAHEPPKSLAEQREELYEKAKKDAQKASADRFKGM